MEGGDRTRCQVNGKHSATPRHRHRPTPGGSVHVPIRVEHEASTRMIPVGKCEAVYASDTDPAQHSKCGRYLLHLFFFPQETDMVILPAAHVGFRGLNTLYRT